MTAGYSGTPLVKKLGIKPGDTIAILNPPEGYDQTLGDLPDTITHINDLSQPLDFIHFFTKDRAEFEVEFLNLKTALKPAGMLWISWPKKASKVLTDLDENIIREIGLVNGLVDVKVAAIDAVWSGLKFVYRLEDR
jgi:hypothetical protein